MNGDFIHRASRIISGEADQSEEAVFFAELEQNPELNKEFQELKTTWDESKKYERPSFAAADWSKLEARLGNESKKFGLRFSFSKLAIAASLTLIAAVSWVLWVQVFSWETVTADSGNQEIILPDMSRVVLKQGSELRYKKAFTENRSLKLNGEAFFEVTKDKVHPFHIGTRYTETVVLGTAFAIREWNENGDVEIRVTEGKVSFSGGENALILEKGMAARYSNSSHHLEAIPFGSNNNVSWIDGILHFENTDIQTALEDIGHYFGVHIIGRLPNDYCALTGDYGQNTKAEMLEILRKILELDIEEQGNNWLVKKGTCRK